MIATCSICQHSESFHDVWGICGTTCGPCYKNLVCPRCKHTFADHMVSDPKVVCLAVDCEYDICFDQKRPDKPVRHLTLVPSQPTYEETLQHPLALSARSVLAPSDPEKAPGVWEQYKAGRTWDNVKQGYVLTDPAAKNPNGSYKYFADGRTWESRLSGYVDVVPPGPPEHGYIE